MKKRICKHMCRTMFRYVFVVVVVSLEPSCRELAMFMIRIGLSTIRRTQNTRLAAENVSAAALSVALQKHPTCLFARGSRISNQHKIVPFRVSFFAFFRVDVDFVLIIMVSVTVLPIAYCLA